ncbi:DNA glycosylase, partial [Mollisia scopiformis]
PSPSPRKKSRSPSGYAPPETYAHLPELQDVLASNLICIFIGLNPGIATAVHGHAYAHPSNLFWKLLHSSGCTTRRCSPVEDRDLPSLFSLGNTNIVARPTRNGSELSKAEMDASVQTLEAKIARYRPEAVCIVGKSIWESIWRVKHGRKMRKEEFRYGWQDEGENMGVGGEEKWEGARVFVACSTSGLAATLLPVEKERIWRELGVWVEERRGERA